MGRVPCRPAGSDLGTSAATVDPSVRCGRPKYRGAMNRALTDLERNTALLLIRRGHTSPSAEDYAEFTPEQKEGWDPPTAITDAQRALWEANLAEVVVTSACGCGMCPTVDLDPVDGKTVRSDDDLVLSAYLPRCSPLPHHRRRCSEQSRARPARRQRRLRRIPSSRAHRILKGGRHGTRILRRRSRGVELRGR